MANPSTPPQSPDPLVTRPSPSPQDLGALTPPASPLVTPSKSLTRRKAYALPAPGEFPNTTQLDMVTGNIGCGQWSSVSMVLAGKRRLARKRPAGKMAHKIMFREAQILTILSGHRDASKYVVAFHGLDASDNSLILDFVPCSLETSVKSTGPISTAADLAQLTRQLVEGLRFMHDCNVIHGDIKPGNILMTGDAHPLRPVYCDFSASRIDVPHCKPNESAGSYDFMAPELFSWKKDEGIATVPSDVFALGMTLIWAALGHSPYEHAATYTKVYMAKQGQPLQLVRDSSWADQATTVSLDQCVAGALKKQPSDRWTADQWLQRMA